MPPRGPPLASLPDPKNSRGREASSLTFVFDLIELLPGRSSPRDARGCHTDTKGSDVDRSRRQKFRFGTRLVLSTSFLDFVNRAGVSFTAQRLAHLSLLLIGHSRRVTSSPPLRKFISRPPRARVCSSSSSSCSLSFRSVLSFVRGFRHGRPRSGFGFSHRSPVGGEGQPSWQAGAAAGVGD